MQRWMVRLAAGYAGLWAVVYMLYRAAYLRTQEVRAWTDRSNRELAQALEELRTDLRDLQESRRAGATPALHT